MSRDRPAPTGFCACEGPLHDASCQFRPSPAQALADAEATVGRLHVPTSMALSVRPDPWGVPFGELSPERQAEVQAQDLVRAVHPAHVAAGILEARRHSIGRLVPREMPGGDAPPSGQDGQGVTDVPPDDHGDERGTAVDSRAGSEPARPVSELPQGKGSNPSAAPNSSMPHVATEAKAKEVILSLGREATDLHRKLRAVVEAYESGIGMIEAIEAARPLVKP